MSVAADLRYSEASQLARFMGLPKWADIDDLDLVERVERGFPTKAAETIIRRIDPDGLHLKVTDIIPKATYHRLKEQSLTKGQSEKILALARVFSETMRQYKDHSALAMEFLLRPHPMFGGRTPFDLARESTSGADLVLKLLARAESGLPV